MSGKSQSHTAYMTKDVANVRFRGINEGRMAAREVDLFLENNTNLPVTGGIVKRTAQEILNRVVEAQ